VVPNGTRGMNGGTAFDALSKLVGLFRPHLQDELPGVDQPEPSTIRGLDFFGKVAKRNPPLTLPCPAVEVQHLRCLRTPGKAMLIVEV
jgi:hypothetical protein